MESELIQVISGITESINALAQPRLIDWLAVILSGISIIVSGVAILFAVRVADKQNKITLFEKRFLCLEEMQRHISFYDKIKTTKELEQIQMAFFGVYCAGLVELPWVNSVQTLEMLSKTLRRIQQIPFLFEGINDKDMQNLYDTFAKLVLTIVYSKHEDIEECVANYGGALRKVGSAYKIIYNKLYLQN